jgi:hypothetical protein
VPEPTNSVVQPPISQTTVMTDTQTYSYGPQPFQARTIEIPVQTTATPTYSYAPQPIQYQQPPVQTIQYQQPVIQYQQPQVQVQVVEKPVVQTIQYQQPPYLDV